MSAAAARKEIREESAREEVANATQLLGFAASLRKSPDGAVVLDADTYSAVMARLSIALKKLDHQDGAR